MTPALAMIQARLHSSRLPGKMLLPLNGRPLLWWAWNAAGGAFGAEHVVIACPRADVDALHTGMLVGAQFFGWTGPENDVLGRLHACAHHYRTDPLCPVWRLTPDDWPPSVDRDLTTLARLESWHETVTDPYLREHVGHLFHPEMAVEVNTPEDLAYLQRKLTHVESH